MFPKDPQLLQQKRPSMGTEASVRWTPTCEELGSAFSSTPQMTYSAALITPGTHSQHFFKMMGIDFYL